MRRTPQRAKNPRFGFNEVAVVGGGSYIACPAVEAGTYSYGTLVQTAKPAILLCGSPCNVTPTWHGYNNTVYSTAHASVSGIVLEASMYGGNTLGMGDGNTPTSWADDVAATAVANHLGIGAESLQLSDLANYASGTTSCSNDWCNLFNLNSLTAPMQGLQTLYQSNPDCITNPSCGDPTGSLLTVLPFGTQRHATVFEVVYLDLLCAYDSGYSNATYCVSGSMNRAGYTGALTAAASGQPASTTAVGGGAKLYPGASLP